jgi:hypothetical protein
MVPPPPSTAATPRLPSGRWRGHYEQMGARFPQEQRIEFADGMLRGEGSDGLGTFRVEGQFQRDGDVVRVGWIKTYDRGHSVLYLGTHDGAAIRGHWQLDSGWRDRFELAPAGGGAAEAAR